MMPNPHFMVILPWCARLNLTILLLLFELNPYEHGTVGGTYFHTSYTYMSIKIQSFLHTPYTDF